MSSTNYYVATSLVHTGGASTNGYAEYGIYISNKTINGFELHYYFTSSIAAWDINWIAIEP